MRREVTADRRSVSCYSTDDQVFTVNSVHQGPSNPDICQRLTLIIHRKNSFTFGRATQGRETIILLEFGEHLRCAQGGHVIQVARLQCRDLGRCIINKAEFNLLDLDIAGVAVLPVLLHGNRITLGPFDELVGPGTNRISIGVSECLLIQYHCRSLGQEKRQQGIG